LETRDWRLVEMQWRLEARGWRLVEIVRDTLERLEIGDTDYCATRLPRADESALAMTRCCVTPDYQLLRLEIRDWRLPCVCHRLTGRD
jgi:hypothetical protein